MNKGRREREWKGKNGREEIKEAEKVKGSEDGKKIREVGKGRVTGYRME